MPISVQRQYSFAAGVNTTDHPSTINRDQMSDCRNIRIDGKAVIERGGQTKLNPAHTLTNPIHSMGHFYSDGGTTYLLGFVGTTLKNLTSNPTTISRTTGSWTGNPTDIAVMNNTAYFADGGAIQKWTGSGNTTAVSGAPTSNLLITHPTANRLFANDTSNPQRVYYSALGDPDDWSTLNDAGFFDVPFTEGENLKAFGIAPSGFLLLFSESSTHVLTGTDGGNFSRREIDPAVGCRARKTVKAGRGGVYFLGQNNRVYWNNGNANIPVGYNVDGILDSGSTGDYPNAQAWVEGTRYHLAIPLNGSTNDTVLVLDWAANGGQGAWMIDGLAVSSASVDTGGQEIVYTGDYSGYVQQQDSATTDNGTAVASYVTTAEQTYDEPERRKKTKRTYIKYVPMGDYNLTVDVAKDGESFTPASTISMASGAAALDDASYGLDDAGTALDGGETSKVTRVSTIRNCRSLTHKFSISNPFKLIGYSTTLRKKYLK